MGVLGATALLHGTKGDLDALRDEYHGPVNSSIFHAKVQRYTDYVIVSAECAPDGHQGYHSTRYQLYDPTTHGDKWASLKAFVVLPDIQRNATTFTAVNYAGRDNDAYYVQDVGFAMFPEVIIRTGGVDLPVLTDHHSMFYYQQQHPDSREDIDENIGHYRTVGDLKQAASAPQILVVPFLAPYWQMRKNPHRAFPLNHTAAQPTQLKVRMREIYEITVNELEETAKVNPWKKGTSTPITSNDISVRFFSNFLLMHHRERSAQRQLNLTNTGITMDFHYFATVERVSNESAGTLISWELDVNHTTNGFVLYYQPNNYIDGSFVSPCGVGAKNYYDFSDPNGSESLYNFGMWTNNTGLIDDTEPISIRRAGHHDMHNDTPHWTTFYTFTVDCKGMDNAYETHTFNPSCIEKFKISFRKNSSGNGTAYAMFSVKNLFFAQGLYGGLQFVGK